MSPTGTVLFVEDDEDTATITRAMIESLGFKVIAANNGAAAMTILKKQAADIDIILSDIGMPEMNGFELCTLIKADDAMRDIPLIFLSARNTLEDKLLGYSVGAEDYIIKPIQMPELTNKLTALLEFRQTNRQLAVELKKNKAATQTILRHFSEIEHVVDFYTKSASAEAFDSLAKILFAALESMHLKGVVQFRNKDNIQHFSSTGAVSPLEASLLHLSSDKSRFIEHGPRLMINHKYLSILIKNMPENDAGRYKEAKVNLENIGIMLELKAKMLFADELTRNNAEVLETVHRAVEGVNALVKHLQMMTQRASAQLSENMESLFIQLGLSETQEQQIRALLHTNQAQIDHAMEQGVEVKKHFSEIDEHLKNILSSRNAH